MQQGWKRGAWSQASAAILLAPLLVRAPAWLAGLRDSPIWLTGQVTAPGATQLLPGLPFLDLNAGWTTQALGTIAAKQWLSGHIPWWDPFSGIGMPLAAEMQSSALFLPYILLLALPAGMALLMLALQWTAGLSTLGLLRRLGLGPLAAAAGAILFALSASFAWMGAPAGLPVAFLPLFLLGIERAFQTAAAHAADGIAPHTPWRMIALAVALSLYAGFPETAYLDGLLALLWAALRAWALAGQGPMPWPRLKRFARSVLGGGAVGLLLAAPVLWPFADLLLDAELGTRSAVDMASLALPAPGLSQWLTPYALGPIAGFSDADPSGALFTIWGRAGGYLGASLALAAILGAIGPGIPQRPERLLRRALLGVALLLLARTAGLPGASAAFSLIPFHNAMQIFRYAGAAWILPCCILAAYAIQQGAQSVRPTNVRQPALIAIPLAVAGAVALTASWPLVRTIPAASPWFWASAALGALTLAASAWAFAHRGPATRAALLLTESACLCLLPMLSGVVNPTLDAGAIAFLQAHAGLQRIATLGPFQPNYPGAFGIASVNSNYLPTPSRWSQHILEALRPGGTPVLFTGLFPPDLPGQPSNADILAAHLPAYAALGVRYLLAFPGQPLPDGLPPPSATPPTPLAMVNGATLKGTLDNTGGPARRLAVTIGTYAGTATGTLTGRLCSGTDCAEATAPLQGAQDNAPLILGLDHPVTGSPLAWTLRYQGPNGVAIWLYGGAPQLTLLHGAEGSTKRVYTGPAMTIDALEDPAPYFTVTGGPCRLAVRTRTRLAATCDAPAHLTRRELAMPGWETNIGTGWAPVEHDGPLFQQVPLPPGPSTIRYRYRPPHFWELTLAFALGLAALLPWRRTRRAVRK